VVVLTLIKRNQKMNLTDDDRKEAGEEYADWIGFPVEFNEK